MATLYKRPNGVYYFITTFHGRQIWHSTGAGTKKEAKKVVAEKFTRKEETIPQLTLSQFTTQFVSYAESNFARGTILLCIQAAGTFKRLIGDFNLRVYKIQDVEKFKSKRLKEVSEIKVDIDFRAVRAFFQTALRWKLVEQNPFRKDSPDKCSKMLIEDENAAHYTIGPANEYGMKSDPAFTEHA